MFFFNFTRSGSQVDQWLLCGIDFFFYFHGDAVLDMYMSQLSGLSAVNYRLQKHLLPTWLAFTIPYQANLSLFSFSFTLRLDMGQRSCTLELWPDPRWSGEEFTQNLWAETLNGSFGQLVEPNKHLVTSGFGKFIFVIIFWHFIEQKKKEKKNQSINRKNDQKIYWLWTYLILIIHK